MVMVLFASATSILCVFPYCYYASKIVPRLQYFADIAFESLWYQNIPVYLQKHLVLIIAYAHIRRKIQGYGMFDCDLEGFMKVNEVFLKYEILIWNII